MLNYLKQLIKIPSVSGREGRIAEYIRGETEKYFDECRIDPLGNLICHKKGSGKRMLFCAHMDEIGFIVTCVDENGFVHFAPVGGIDYVSAAYSTVVFESGLKGALVPEDGVKPEDLKPESFAVDIGAKTKKEAERLVSTGDTFAVEPSLKKLRGGRICGRPLDDKIGCAVLMAAARESESFVNDTVFVFSVQEEVGLRGAKTAAFSAAADCSIAVDVTMTGDSRGAKPMAVRLGEGPAVKIKDRSVICDASVISLLERAASENGIKYQREVLTVGGTDTASLQLAGAGSPAGCISVPARYIHTSVETVDIKDAEGAVSLVCAAARTKL